MLRLSNNKFLEHFIVVKIKTYEGGRFPVLTGYGMAERGNGLRRNRGTVNRGARQRVHRSRNSLGYTGAAEQ
jgi:hypothetical protein